MRSFIVKLGESSQKFVMLLWPSAQGTPYKGRPLQSKKIETKKSKKFWED